MKRKQIDPNSKTDYLKVKQSVDEYLDIFNDPEKGPRKAIQKHSVNEDETQEKYVSFFKWCNRLNESMMIEILGYHKEPCMTLMKKYIESFAF